MIDLTPMINALIALLGVVVVYYAVPWLKGRVSSQQRYEVQEWVRIGCMAAEQLYNTGMISDRKAYVLDYLAGKNLKIDLTEIEKMIEAMVLEINRVWTEEEESANEDKQDGTGLN